jgi:type III secretory pathway component EscS
MQVLLERLAYKVALETSEERLLGGLASKHGEHAPGDTYHGVVLVVIQVLVRAERQDAPHGIQVLIVFVAILRVTWDIHAVNVAKFTSEICNTLSIVNWDNSGASSL